MIRLPRAATSARGFTLIEMMAVLALIGMIVALGIPRLSSSRWRALGNAADAIAESLEFARQRAVMTGVPHRVLINLADGGWRVEWLASESEALAATGGGEADAGAGGGLGDLLAAQGAGASDAKPGKTQKIDLHPPSRATRDYRPVPNRQLGSWAYLDDSNELYFVGIVGADGWVESGDVQIVFDADGTTDHTLVEIADADERHMTLEIEPLLDRIRRRDGPARS
jgi:type II secretion system protein H